ncbi:hypothetical protein UPYG_G00090400 [Umbra pygmaea]|uniref:THAP domain-containing protein 1 n=1 Tax=Umbra pygmaea TaxID=75934 RepID=A0ABD0XX30_UMBPY
MAQTTSKSSCSVPGCFCYSQKQPYLSFHSFPIDGEVRRKWIQAIRRDEGPNFTVKRGSTYVCSRHFTSDDYVLGITVRRLNPEAVPSLFPWNDFTPKGKRDPVYERCQKRQPLTSVGVEIKEIATKALKLDHDYATPPPAGQPAYEMMETDPDWAPSLPLGHTEITRTNTALSARRRKKEQVKNTLQPAEGEGELHTEDETQLAGDGERHTEDETQLAGDGERHIEEETHEAGDGERHIEEETHEAGDGERHIEEETHEAGDGERHIEEETHEAGDGEPHIEEETHEAGDGERHIEEETREAEGRSERHIEEETHEAGDGERHIEEETQNTQEVTVTQTECNFRVHRCAEVNRLLEENRPHLGMHLDHPYAMNCQEPQGKIPGQLSEKTFTNKWEISTETTNEPSFSGTQTANSLLSPVVSATLEESYVTGMDVPVTCVQGKERVDAVHLPNVDSRLGNDHQTSVNFSETAAFLQSNDGKKIACTQPNKPLNIRGEQFFILSTTSSGSVERKTNPSAPGCSQSLLTSTLQHSVPQHRLFSHNCKTWNKPCHKQTPPVERKCPVSHKDVRNPFPKCTKLGLNLNVRPKEKLDLTLLTNGVMVEIHNFASKIRTAFRFVVFDILEHNFDIGLLSEQRWRFVNAIDLRMKAIKKKCNSKHFFLNEVFTLPDLQKKIKPISEAALLAKASRDKDPYMTLKQKLAKQRKIQYRKRRYVSKYQIARDQEKAIKFEKAHEAINKFLMTWFYHNKQLPFLNTIDSMSDQTDGTSYTTETSTLAKDEPDLPPVSFGQVKEEPISCEAAVTGWAGETAPVQKNEEYEIDIMSNLVKDIKTESKSEAFETPCTSQQAVPCQKDEPCDISIKDEPDFHPICWSETKEEAPWNRTEDALYTDRTGKLPQNHGLNIISITNESDLHREMQGHVRTLEQSSLPHVKRTYSNPYPYCRRIGLDLVVKSKLGVKKKLDLRLLTMGIMLEIHDFAKEVCALSKEICVSVVKEHFHLDLEKEEFLCSENLGTIIKRFTKKHALKEKLLNEPFSFSSQVQKPSQRTSRCTALPNASLLLKIQRFKDLSEKRRLAVKKKKEERAKMWAKEKEKPAIK